MKSMKKFLAVAMILLMTAALAACGGDTKDSGSSDSSADAPKASGDVLIVGTEPTFPPFDTTDDNGDIVGFDMDLIKAIGKDQDLKWNSEISNSTVSFRLSHPVRSIS